MPIYTETQRLRQPWLLALLGIAAVLAIVQQITRRKSSGDQPLPDWGAVLFIALFVVGLPAALWVFRMKTEIYPDRIEIDMRPLTRRTIPISGVSGATARIYRPLREFGGWGIRGLPSNRAYNMSGDQGVQLLLTNGAHILIGTQRPDELEAAIVSALPQ